MLSMYIMHRFQDKIHLFMCLTSAPGALFNIFLNFEVWFFQIRNSLFLTLWFLGEQGPVI
jgi:hypothetical protein